MTLEIFLCHTHHSNKDAVKVLYDRLTKDHLDALLDQAKPGGERSQTSLPGMGNLRFARLSVSAKLRLNECGVEIDLSYNFPITPQ